MKKVIALLLCLVLVMGTLTACGSSSTSSTSGGNTTNTASGSATTTTGNTASGTTSTSSDGTIKLGMLAPLTGDYAEYGKGFQVAAQMAIDEINAKGGANGHKLSIEVKDSAGDPVTSSTLCTEFAEDDSVMAIVGDFTSGCCKANATICDQYGIVQLSPTASASDYASMSKYCFSIMGRQDIEAPYLASVVLQKKLQATNIAVIRVDSDWGKSCYDNFIAKANEIGLKVSVETYAAGEKDFSSIITKVKSTNPDVLVVMDQGDAVSAIFNQADAAGWKIQHVALGPGTSSQLADQLTDKSNLIVTTPFFFDESNADLMKWYNEFTTKAGFNPTIHPACAYDCVYLLARAIENIGSGEITRAAIQDKLQNGGTYTGLTGDITFTENGDIARNYEICTLKDGKWSILEGFDYGK